MRLAELELPATPEFVSLARLIISSLADDRYELSDDKLSNLKLAVSEACVLAIEFSQGSPEAYLALRCRGGQDQLEVTVTSTAPMETDAAVDGNSHLVDPDRSHVIEVGLPLIGSLVDEVRVDGDERSKSVHMTIHCEPAEEL